MSMTTGNMSLLTRAELWSQELKDTLKDELVGRKYVRMLTEFPDGSQFNIPSIGDARTDDVVEDSSGHYITRRPSRTRSTLPSLCPRSFLNRTVRLWSTSKRRC